MSTRDKELKESFMKLFQSNLHESEPTYFDRKKDPMVEDMSFSEDELLEIESELKSALLKGVLNNDSSES